MTIKLVIKNENRDIDSAVRVLTLKDLFITLGSGETATVLLSDPEIALEQAVIINENDQPLFVNRNKGTVLNGINLQQGWRHNLRTGDEIIMGSFRVVVDLKNKDEFETVLLLDEPEDELLAAHELPRDLFDSGMQNIEVTKDNKSDERSFTDVINSLQEEGLLDSASDLFLEDLETIEDNKLDVRSFADILSSLRKEEDQYYFQITEADGSKRRLTVENEEIILGWNNSSNIFTSNRDAIIDRPQAAVRKDWSGVTVYPNGEEAILYNDILLEAGTQLRNGDKLVFTRRLAETVTKPITLVFCEPAALIELNAILPQELLTNALEIRKTGEIQAEPEVSPVSNVRADALVRRSAQKVETLAEKRYFGYFTFPEVLIMFIATVFTAVITFILLHLL